MTQLRLLPALLLVLAAPLSAQTGTQTGPQTSAPISAAPATLPSTLLRPAIAALQTAVTIARPEKWKAPSAVAAESASDISSIQRDLDHTLPPLLSSADSSPSSTSQLLPAYRNVEALYDVLVRVTQTSVLAAPPQQSAAFQQATQSLQQARRNFGDLLDSAVQAQDRRLHDTQARITRLQSAPPPPAPVCPTPPPAKKPTPKRKSTTAATKPATPPTTK
ncbi:MAG: hypothetical protein M3O31_05200 [Acidobacteriota bacterium]|nr:hypothetical protein [Acidobacteriota bacterium]